VVGVPGVLFALILRLTLKEPQRGRWDGSSQGKAAPGLKETLGLLRDRPSFWYLALGASCIAYVSYGNGNFMPSFLIRNHGLSLGEVGVALALVSGLSGAIGTFLGGYLSDRYGRKDMRWYLWIPVIGIALGYLPFTYMLLTDNTTTGLTAVFLAVILQTFYLGPCIALSHAMMPPGMRALTSAVLFFVLNIIGLGLGPFLTGLSSDLLQPEFGDDALRYAMIGTLQMSLLAVALFLLAAKHLRADLAKV
jgi:MFS family permease